MKWWTIFCVTITGLIFANTLLATENDTSKPVKVKSISYTIDEQEIVNFQLSAPMKPKVFSMKGEKPRIVVDLPEALYAGPKVDIPEGASLVSRLRIGLHEEPALKTRVVLDLNPAKTIDYSLENQGESIKIVLKGVDKEVVAEPPASSSSAMAGPASDLAASTPPPAKKSAESPEPETVMPALEKKNTAADTAAMQPVSTPRQSKEDLAAKPLDQKPVPPVFAVKSNKAKEKKQKEPVLKKTAELQKISFDDSSDKGEMVLFQLNDFYPPSVTAIETDNPGVVCEFAAMSVADTVDKTIHTNGKFVERISTERMADSGKVKVILELAPSYDYDLQQVFFKTDNLFVLIVNELGTDKKSVSAQN